MAVKKFSASLKPADHPQNKKKLTRKKKRMHTQYRCLFGLQFGNSHLTHALERERIAVVTLLFPSRASTLCELCSFK